VRCVHEAQLHKNNLFLTLTYNDETCPKITLVKKHFVHFFKRLREHHFRQTGERKKLRYFMCGEYGEETGRPHYHALVFGLELPDLRYHKQTKTGLRLYTSGILENIWGKGHCLIGSVAFESAAYVAGYVYKKQTGDKRKTIDIIDIHTGQIHRRQKEYGTMSRNPGLGREWLRRFATDVYPKGTVVSRAHEAPAPRYYDNLFRLEDQLEYESMKNRRRIAAELKWEDSTNKRLATRETVEKARLALGKRGL